jgi:hypothetical protein
MKNNYRIRRASKKRQLAGPDKVRKQAADMRVPVRPDFRQKETFG